MARLPAVNWALTVVIVFSLLELGGCAFNGYAAREAANEGDSFKNSLPFSPPPTTIEVDFPQS